MAEEESNSNSTSSSESNTSNSNSNNNSPLTWANIGKGKHLLPKYAGGAGAPAPAPPPPPPAWAPRPAFNAAKLPARPALKGVAGGPAGGAGGPAAGRRIQYNPHLNIKAFGAFNEPGRVSNAPETHESTKGNGLYAVNWAGIAEREGRLRRAGYGPEVTGDMGGLISGRLRREAKAMGGVHPPKYVTSAFIGSHSLGRKDVGWPSYELSAGDPRRNEAWSRERALRRQLAIRERMIEPASGITHKLHYPNRSANLRSIRASYGYPETEAKAAAALEARHTRYAANAVRRAAELETELGAGGGASGGGNGSGSGAKGGGEEGGRRRTRHKRSRRTQRNRRRHSRNHTKK